MEAYLQTRVKACIAAIYDNNFDGFVDNLMPGMRRTQQESIWRAIIDAEFYPGAYAFSEWSDIGDTSVIEMALAKHKHALAYAMKFESYTLYPYVHADVRDNGSYGICEMCFQVSNPEHDTHYWFLHCIRRVKTTSCDRGNSIELSALLRTGLGRRSWLKTQRYSGSLRFEGACKDLMFRFGVTNDCQMASLQVLAARSLHRR